MRAPLCLFVGVFGGFLYGSFSSKNAEPVGEAPVAAAKKTAEAEVVGPKSKKMKMLLRAETDPWGALAALERDVENSAWRLHRGSHRELFRTWAQRDLEGAIRALGSVVHDARHEAVTAVLEVAFEQDPERAMQVMKEWQRYAGLPSWLKENPLETIEHFPRVASGQDGADHFSFPKALVAVDPKAGLDWALSLSGERREGMVREVIEAWARSDVAGAILGYGDGSGFDWQTRREFAKQISLGLAKTDPPAALGWLDASGLEKNDRENGMSKIVSEWGKQDLDGAIGWIKAQPILDQKQALSALASSWANHDLDAAADFYMSVGPENQSDWSAAKQIASVYLEKDPVAALDWVDQLPMGTRSPVEADIFSSLLKKDRELAISELTARIRRVSAPTVEQLAADFFKADAEVARAWLETLPEGLARQSAMKGMGLEVGG